MTLGGWIMMSVSICFVLALSSYCLYRVATLPPADLTEHIKSPPDIDTKDTENGD